jgi:N-formylmaleamate deformylase
MSDWTEADVTAAGIRIHYTRCGAGAPLVLAHGVTDFGRNWTTTAERLERRFDIVMPDARGHGLSEAPASGYRVADLAADLGALIRALGLARPALMGHSLGAATVAFAAAAGLAPARCLVLEDPPWRDGAVAPPAEREQRVRERRAEIERRRVSPTAELERLGRSEHPGWSVREIRLWAEAKRLVRPEVAEIFAQPMPQGDEIADRIGCPVLLLTGDQDRGAIVSPATAERFRSALAARGVACQVARVGGAGHNIRRDAFEETAALVEGFLARHGARSAAAGPTA